MSYHSINISAETSLRQLALLIHDGESESSKPRFCVEGFCYCMSGKQILCLCWARSSFVRMVSTESPENLNSLDFVDYTQTVVDFEKVCITDISWTCGRDYLYVHNESCEHTFQLVGISRVSGDPFFIESNDRSLQMPRKRRCLICDVFSAQCIVFNDRLSDCDPLLCCK